MIEEPEVVLHEADQPDFFVDFLHADVLTREHRRQVDLARAEAHAAAHGHGDRAIVERVLERILAYIDVLARKDLKKYGLAGAGCERIGSWIWPTYPSCD